MFNLNDFVNIKDNFINEFVLELKNVAKELNLNEEYYIVDRLEGKYAVCENENTRETKDIFLKDLPRGIKEGDIIYLNNNKYIIDIEKTKNKEIIIQEKLNKLWK